MLDDDQGLDAPQVHGVQVDEVGREDAAGLHGQELFPRRAGTAGRPADTGIMHNPPHRGCCDRVAKLDEFALVSLVPPARIVGRDADHELADRGYGSSWSLVYDLR
jgi:hypothetical protein